MDELNNLIDTGRFMKVMADIETGRDEPEPHQFKRDQQLTPAALFKAKVLAVLRDEIDGDSPSDHVVSELIRRVEGITP